MTALFLSKLGKPALLATAAFVLSMPGVRGETLDSYINLGQAKANSGHKWAIFTLGSAVTDTDAISGLASIIGDIGAAGSGNVNMAGGATETGNLYYHTGGAFKGTGVSGTKTSNVQTDNILNQGVNDAKSASSQATSLAASLFPGGPTSVALTSGTTTYTAGGPSDRYVMRISNFTMSNATLNLTGDANSSFVFDISGTFSLANSKIVLNGGLSAANVLFNYTGTSTVLIGNSSQFHGIILAAAPTNYATSNIQVGTSSSVTGEIIADKVTIAGGATITQGIVSP